MYVLYVFFFKQKTAYEMRISDWSSDVCSSDLPQLLADSAVEISTAVGPRAHVVEYGSGSGRKTRLLLDALDDPVAYTPIEISRSALLASVERLDREFDDVEVLPVCADFTQPVPLPRPARAAEHALVFFPGSTLGNFTHNRK